MITRPTEPRKAPDHLPKLRPKVFVCALVFGAACLFSCRKDKVERESRAPKVVTTRSGVRMVLLPGGWFTMGSGYRDEIDEPPHKVCVGPFYIDQYEVTQAEYEKVMKTNPSRWKHPKHPVDQIRWYDAVRYCNARSRLEGLTPAYDLKTGKCDFGADGYRLPTEAEWEYAARAGTATPYFFGDSAANLKRYAWFKDSCDQNPQPVGAKLPNGWGLHDLYGNVWEWCHDFYQEDYYKHSPQNDPRGPRTGKTRVLRGGCWNSRPGYCRSSYREHEDPAFTDVCFRRAVHGFCGFRCVRRYRAPSD